MIIIILEPRTKDIGVGLFKGDFLKQTKCQINYLSSVLPQIKGQIKYLCCLINSKISCHCGLIIDNQHFKKMKWKKVKYIQHNIL